MKNTIDEICPLKKVSRKQAQLIHNPWMTKEILKEINIRDKLKMKFIKDQNSKGSNDHKIWKKQRNKVNRMVLAAKSKDTANDCEKARGSSSKMWKVINKATNKKSKPNTFPEYVRIKDADGNLKKTKCKITIANEMNRLFTEMGGKLADKLPSTDASFTDYLKSPNSSSLFMKDATENEVGNHVQDLDDG